MKPDATTRKLPLYLNLVDAIATWEYNSTHTHREIADILGVDPQTGGYYRLVSLANEEATELHRKHLENISDHGYRIINPGEYVRKSFKEVKKSDDHLDRAVTLIQHSPRDKMTADELKKTEVYGTRIAALKAYSGKSVRAMKTIVKASDLTTLPTPHPKPRRLAGGGDNSVTSKDQQ